MLDRIKLNKAYSKIYFATAVYHIIFVFLYFKEGFDILAFYNIFSIVFYTAIGFAARNAKKLGYLFIICFAEIIVFSILSTMLLGWNSGFMLYFVGILPLIFYSVYLFRGTANRITFGVLAGTLIAFYITLEVSFHKVRPYYTVDLSFEHLLYIMNVTVMFMLLVCFLFIFIAKMKVAQDELIEENSMLENSANYDTLTKLLNRRSFDNYFARCQKEAAANASSFALLICDIDDFKKVNDTFGHECGDKVLINVAGALKKNLRDKDLLFRWGGEEFLIILANESENAYAIAERCRKTIEETSVFYDNEEVKVTVTIGGSIYFPGESKESMINSADQKMYYGKTNDKNQVVL